MRQIRGSCKFSPNRERKPHTCRGSIPPPPPPTPIHLPCIYEGGVIRACGRGDNGHLRECQYEGPERDWDHCRRDGGNPKNGEQSCIKCPARKVDGAPVVSPARPEMRLQPLDPNPTRHLLYYILPLPNSELWRWNIDELKQRWSVFNGRKIIAIAQGSSKHRPGILPTKTVPFDEVVKAFDDPTAEFIRVENNPRLREVVAYDTLFDRLLPTSKPDLIFYAHAKGVSKTSGRDIDISRRWTKVMYDTCLDYIPLVESQLQTKAMTGSIRAVDNPAFGSSWQYSGTFMWIRADEMSRRPWKAKMPRHWAGTEDVWGILYDASETDCLFYDRHTGDVYSAVFWADAEQKLIQWKSENHRYSRSF